MTLTLTCAIRSPQAAVKAHGATLATILPPSCQKRPDLRTGAATPWFGDGLAFLSQVVGRITKACNRKPTGPSLRLQAGLRRRLPVG